MALNAGVETFTLGNFANSVTSGANDQIINANALVDAQVLTLAGTHNVTVSLMTGDITSTSTGNITVNATTGTNVITTGSGNDTITGDAGNDSITGGAGADNINAGAGDDRVIFNTGDVASGEVIDGGSDNGDVIVVETSTDFTNLGAGAVKIRTNAHFESIEIVSGQAATFTDAQLSGESLAVNSSGAATLNINVASGAMANFSDLSFGAGTFTVNLNGAGGNESITGSAVNDVITGGVGADVLAGGAGADTFVFATGDGNTITTIDEIVDLLTDGADTIKTGVTAVDGANYAELDEADYGPGVADLTELITAANTAFGVLNAGVGNPQFVIAENGSTDAANGGVGGISTTFSYLIIDWDGNNTADQAIKLTGVTDVAAAGITAALIVA